jgi:hypothetical protein
MEKKNWKSKKKSEKYWKSERINSTGKMYRLGTIKMSYRGRGGEK